MTTFEAAKEIGVSPEYIRQMIAAGKIKARRYHRSWIISKSSLMKFKTQREAA